MNNEKLVFYIDGASKGNPGHSGIGVVMCDLNHKEIQAFNKYIGETTNNVAEYMALLIALQEAVKVSVKDIAIYCDSELVVRQVNRIYKVKDTRLKQLYTLFDNLKGYFKRVSIEYISREKNKRADYLATLAVRKRK